MSRRESVGRLNPMTQSDSGPVLQQIVTVAVLAPTLPAFAIPSGIGGSDAFGWDESLNYRQPESKQGERERKQSLRQKAGLTTQRQRRNPDLPPFIHKKVPYDVWRRHYAKDKDGNYKGTHAPAEDCLLKPDDVAKWNAGLSATRADKWTRGKEVLPVYQEAQEDGTVPEYEVDYDGPPRDGGSSREEQLFTGEEDDIARHLERRDITAEQRREQVAALEAYSQQKTRPQPESVSAINGTTLYPNPGAPLDGRRAEDVIAEAKAKGKPARSWKKMLEEGVKMASFGS